PVSGTYPAELELMTPGMVRTRSRPRRIAAEAFAVFVNCGPFIHVYETTTLLASNPLSTLRREIKDRISSDEAVSSITAMAISLMTSKARVLFWRRPVAQRPPLSFSVEFRSTRAPAREGSIPNIRAVTIQAARANAITCQSSSNFQYGGRSL